KEGVGEFSRVKGLLSQGGYRLFNFNGVHSRASVRVRVARPTSEWETVGLVGSESGRSPTLADRRKPASASGCLPLTYAESPARAHFTAAPLIWLSNSDL